MSTLASLVLGVLALAGVACAQAAFVPGEGGGGGGGEDDGTTSGFGANGIGGSPAATSSSASGGACLPGLSSCDGVCVDTRTDAANCGHCSDACSAGATCVNGTCAIGCDGTGNCGQCLDCSGSVGVCQIEVEKCLVDPECKAIVTCIGACGDDPCVDGCFAQHPSATPTWQAAFQCAHCDACPSDCEVTTCP